MSRVGLLDELLVVVGFPDVQVGDDIFDQAFRVNAENPERACQFLREEVRSALLRLGGRPLLTDHMVQTHFEYGQEGSELLTEACHGVALVARLVQRVPPRLPYR